MGHWSFLGRGAVEQFKHVRQRGADDHHVLDVRVLLERELLRKDKALAETAALLVLKKKVQEYWGDEDDVTKKETDK